MKYIFTLLAVFAFTISYAQASSAEEQSSILVKQGKVVLEKELDLIIDSKSAYQILRLWAKDNYGRDPFISSVRYDNQGKFITAKSRIELLLPPDSKNIREKIVMRYRIDASIANGKCVVTFREIAYLYENPQKPHFLPKISKAEELITDQALSLKDSQSELRSNVRKSTLYFISQTTQELDLRLHGK
ncbi:MAG: putative rane protein [Bacteroidetes bacterium]|nr:putative rane protein [Bacteroidota bacterium]